MSFLYNSFSISNGFKGDFNEIRKVFDFCFEVPIFSSILFELFFITLCSFVVVNVFGSFFDLFIMNYLNAAESIKKTRNSCF